MKNELPFLPAAGSLIYTYTPAYTNDWFFLYPRGLWCKYVEIIYSCISAFTPAHVCMAA